MLRVLPEDIAQAETYRLSLNLSNTVPEKLFGRPFLMGRDFLPEERIEGRDHVVILTRKLWAHLGSDPKITSGLPDNLGIT